MNIRLKTKILEQGLSQLQVARDVGLTDSNLSKIIHGWVDPPVEVKTRLASVLGCNLEEIFPDPEGLSPVTNE